MSSPPVESESTELLGADKAYAFPAPGDVGIVSVVETRFSNATQQDILLDTDASTSGQNMLRVQFFGPVDPKRAGRGSLQNVYLPQSTVRSEMAKLFPGVRMVQSPYYVQNKYGPFGYAVGTRKSDRCFYGWQEIHSTGRSQTLIGNKGAIRVRLRICKQGASEQDLLASMYGFTVTNFFKEKNWNPYGEAAPPNAAIGTNGQAIAPIGAGGLATVSRVTLDQPAPPRRRAARRASVAAAAPRDLPEPIGPTVPLPPGGVQSAQGKASNRAVSAPIPARVERKVNVPVPPCADGNDCTLPN